MKKYYRDELAVYIRREKEIEKQLQQLNKDFKTWTERIELAKKSDRPDLVTRATQRLKDLRAEAWGLKTELEDIVKKKREIRVDSRRPTGIETRRAQSLLKSFKESGLVDPDEAQLESDIREAALEDDTDLDALKAKAGMTKEAPADAGRAKTEPSEKPKKDLDAELAALRAKMGTEDNADGEDDDIDLDELEKMFAEEEDDDETDGETDGE